MIRSWFVHNVIGHPLSEVAHLARMPRVGNWLHDRTLPVHEEGTGRG